MKRKLKNKLEQLEKSFSELAKDVAELKQKENALTITSEHTKNLEVDFENVETKNVSGWYKDDRYPKWLMYIDFENNKCFGFDSNRDWLDSSFSFEYKLNKAEYTADPSEVEQVLIAEAKKRGYGKGVFCLFGKDKKKREITYHLFKYHHSKNILLIGNDIVFRQGEWAEIIEETPIKEEDAIDWSKSGIIMKHKDIDLYILTGGTETARVFYGTTLKYDSNQYKNTYIGEYDQWNKELFKPFKGTLTINKE